MLFLTTIAPILYTATFGKFDLGTLDVKQDTATYEKQDVTEPDNTVLCSCVSFVRQYRPDLPSQNASKFVATSSVPTVGAAVLLFYPHSGMSHVALVTSVGTSSIEIAETNFNHCEFGTRTIELPHNRIIGYL